MEKNENRKIYILLTSFPDMGSKMVGFMTNSIFTHASIGLDEDLDTFYSFAWKGFIVEKITKYIRPDRKPYPCELYEMDVSAEKYELIKKILLEFVENRHKYSFARAGLILGLMRMPLVQKRKYFCSQFIADVFKRSKALHLKKNSARYFPRDFGRFPEMSLAFKGNLSGMIKMYKLRMKTAKESR